MFYNLYIGFNVAVYHRNRGKTGNISCREYVCFRFQFRPNDFNLLLHAGRLTQQFSIDSYIKIETQRLDFYRMEQQQMDARTESLQGIVDSLGVNGVDDPSQIGYRIVLPSSFIGGPRDMMKRYVNAMSLVQKYGKPDLFITMTCNPNWKEIKDNLLPMEDAQDRPDLIARVFRAKLEEFKDEIVRKKLFGEIAAYVYAVEYQKRGLPHAHWVIIFKHSHKLCSPELYDQIICAEIPDDENSLLYSYVVSHMMHGPCGIDNPKNICMRDGKCKNKFPKNFSDVTSHGKYSYPNYRRRNDGRKILVRNIYLDNRYVVPYCPYLLLKFNCHINVEACSDFKLVKYLYKYIYKGHDRINYNIVPDSFVSTVDEIKEFQEGRWISSVEAFWRIFSFDITEMNPPVIVLPVHLPNKQYVSFGRTKPLNQVLANPLVGKTMLTEFFQTNATDSVAKNLNLLYKDFPHFFVWEQKYRKWKLRRKGTVIGRLCVVDPCEGERYFFKLLLCNVPAPTCYEDLLTVQNVLCSSFRAAALQRGLLESDLYVEQCLQESAQFQLPRPLRKLFAILLVYFCPPNPVELFKKFFHVLSDDFSQMPGIGEIDIHNKTLDDIDHFLMYMGRSIYNYSLKPNVRELSEEEKFTRELAYEKNIPVLPEDLLNIDKLNNRQKHAFDSIICKVNTGEGGGFFIDGPGGTGKTFLYRALLSYVRSQGHIALAVATSGVAASLLPGGRTAHSRFKLPMDINEKVNAKISKQSSLARIIMMARLIVWDEASMANKKLIEAFNRLLQDIMDVEDRLFGGKVVVFGGDFRQTLPIVQHASKQQTIHASFVASHIWTELVKIRLCENIRAKEDPMFTSFLLRVGDGSEPYINEDNIAIPDQLCLPFVDRNSSLEQLIEYVFPSIHSFMYDPYNFINRAILTPKNDCMIEINNMLIDKMPGVLKEYISYNKASNPRDQGQYDEFFTAVMSSGLPPHKLLLKKNCPVMLLRNLNPIEGLCNGTRLICRKLGENCIEAEIATGDQRGKIVLIPRIPLDCDDKDKCPISFKRIQFPLRPCFAMTINKAQGQTLDFVGVYLRHPVFAQGQLYVALS